MAATTTLPVLFATGIHASRPAASAVGAGGLYSCTTHSLVYQTDGVSTWSTWASLTGTGMTNPMNAVGDIIQGGTAGAPELLAAPLTGKVLTGAGVTTRVAYAYPPGYEFDYVQITSNVSPTATTEATANTVVTGSAVTYDGSTTIMVEFSAPTAEPDTGATTRFLRFVLYDGASSIGFMGFMGLVNAGTYAPIRLARRLTPSNASHTYAIKAYVDAGTATISAGSGGAAANMPAFIRITKV